MRCGYFIPLFLCLCTTLSCKDNTVVFNRGNPCPPYTKPAPSPYNSPVWHPNGQIIGFNYTPVRRISFPNGEACEGFHEFITDSTGFWLINADGSNLHRIYTDTLITPAWSPDGMWIAVSRGASTPSIYKMRFTGTEFDPSTLVQLAAGGSCLSPSWSPDGGWIAYESNDGNLDRKFTIWKMRSDGSGRRRLSQTTSGKERRPHWSPGGAFIVFQRELIGGIVELFVMDTAGTASQRLTVDQRIDTSPMYSPNGTWIAFLTRGLTGTDDQLVFINNRGTSTQREVASGAGRPFSWSAASNTICYTTYRPRDYTYNNGTLWIANIATLQNRQLTFNVVRP